MPEPIRVTITDETGHQEVNVGTGTADVKSKTAIQNKQTKANEKGSQIAAAGVFVAMQSFNYVTSNVGRYTGRQSIQTNINNAKKLAGYGAALATNWVLALAVIAMDAATTIGGYMYDKKWEDIRSSQAKARNGDLGGYRR